MKERPIIFSAHDVRAILDGRKTQTRRIVKLPHGADVIVQNGKVWKPARVDYEGYVDCPFGQSGDRLWVRETWAWYGCERLQDEVLYRADGVDLPAEFGRWRPSIHMPRWASRILLEVTAVRVERLQDISEADAVAEGGSSDGKGVSGFYVSRTARGAFSRDWESIHGSDSWAQNPWVWVIEFRRVEP